MEPNRVPVVAYVAGVMLVGLLALTACGSGSFDVRDTLGSGGIALEHSPDRAEPAPTGPEAEDRAAAPDNEVRADIITTGSATVRTGDPVVAAADFADTVRDKGGQVADSEISTRYSQPRATVTARIPAADYQAVVDSLVEHGEVVAQSTESTDVGQQKTDLEARTQALQASIERLTELMAGADSVEDLLRAEDMLTSRQAALDSLTAQLDWLADQVALSTLTVTFTVDDDGYVPPNVFQEAWQTFLASLKSIMIVSMGLLPWLVVIGAIVAAVLALVRRRRRRRRRTTQPDE